MIFWNDFRHQPLLEGVNACVGVYMHEYEDRVKDFLKVYEQSKYQAPSFRMYMQEIPVVRL